MYVVCMENIYILFLPIYMFNVYPNWKNKNKGEWILSFEFSQDKKRDNSSFDDSAFEALEKDFQEVSCLLFKTFNNNIPYVEHIGIMNIHEW